MNRGPKSAALSQRRMLSSTSHSASLVFFNWAESFVNWGDSGSERVIFVETPRASHAQQIMDLTLRIKEKSEGTLVIEEWINARL